MATNRRRCAILPFSHLDLFWLGSEEECLARGVGVIARALRLLEAHPDFRFFIEYMVFLDAYLDRYPAEATRVRDLVRQGRLDLGAQWSGIYQDIAQGEDLVRNTEYAVRFCQERIGVTPTVIHLGDLPGYAAWFPEVAVTLGIQYVIVTRGGPKTQSLFWWEAPSGARVLTWNATPVNDAVLGRYKGYAWARTMALHQGVDAALDKKLDQQIVQAAASLAPNVPLLVHWGVDLMLPDEGLLTAVAAWNNRRVADVDMAFVTPTEHYHMLMEAIAGQTGTPPVVRGEVPSLWPYQEAINFAIKGWEMPALHELLNAEVVAAVSARLGLRAYPHGILDHAWKEWLEAADHNLKGTGYSLTRERKRAFQTQARIIAGDVTRRSLASIAGNIHTLPGYPHQIPIVVFNSLNWDRSAPVDIHVTFYGDPEARDWRAYEAMALLDDAGTAIPFEILSERTVITCERTIRFAARDVPGIGWRTWYIVPTDTPCSAATDVWPIDRRVEEGILSVACPPYQMVVDGITGRLSLSAPADDGERPEAARSVDTLDIDLFAELERPGAYDAWVRHLDVGRVLYPVIDEVTVTANSALHFAVRVAGLLANAPFTMTLDWCPHLPTVSSALHVDWQGEPPLRCYLRCRPRQGGAHVRYGVPFGSNTIDGILMPDIGPSAPDELPLEPWSHLRQMRMWADLTRPGEMGGWTITSDKATFRHDPDIGAVDIVLLKSQTAFLGRSEPAEYRSYDAAFTVTYHSEPAREACVWRRGQEAMMPLVAHVEGQLDGPRRLPATVRAIHLDAPAPLAITSVRSVGDTMRVTAYNPAAIDIPRPELHWMGTPVSVERMDVQGRPLRDRGTVGPCEITVLNVGG